MGDRRWIQTFEVDARSLAIFRISLASLILWDLCVRLQNIEAHYTDLGILPRAVAVSENPWMSLFSIHFLSGSLAWQIFLFILSAGAALALMLGIQSKIASIATWFLLMSLQSRNPGLNYGADYLLRLLSFWS